MQQNNIHFGTKKSNYSTFLKQKLTSFGRLTAPPWLMRIFYSTKRFLNHKVQLYLGIMINKINITDKRYSIYLNKVELFELTIGSTLVELSIYKHMVLIRKCYMHNILKNHNYRAITGWFINKNSIKSKLRGKKGKKVCWSAMNLTIYLPENPIFEGIYAHMFHLIN